MFYFPAPCCHLTGGWEAGWFCVKAKKSGEHSGLAGNTGEGGGGESMIPAGSQENSHATVGVGILSGFGWRIFIIKLFYFLSYI